MRKVSAITNLPYTWIGKLWTQLGSLRSVKDTKPWCFGHFMLILRVSLPSPDSWRHGEEQPVFVHRARWTGVPRTARKIQNKPWQWLSNLHPVLYSWSAQGTYQNPENPEEARTKFDMLHTSLCSLLFCSQEFLTKSSSKIFPLKPAALTQGCFWLVQTQCIVRWLDENYCR